MDIYTGMREGQKPISGIEADDQIRRVSVAEIEQHRKKTWSDYPKAVVRAFI